MASLFRIKLFQTGARDQPLLNRFWYYTPSGVAIPTTDVASTFANWVCAGLKLIQSQEFVQVAVEVVEVLEPGLPFLANLTNGAGNQSGDGRASYDTWSFFLKPTGPILKRGGKRIAGVAENQADDDVANTDFVDNLVAFATLLASGLTTEAGPVIVPAIVRETATTYLISQVYAGIYRQLSTQRSRLLSQASGGGLQRMEVYAEEGEVELPTYAGIDTNAESLALLEDLLATAVAPSIGAEVTQPKP